MYCSMWSRTLIFLIIVRHWTVIMVTRLIQRLSSGSHGSSIKWLVKKKMFPLATLGSFTLEIELSCMLHIWTNVVCDSGNNWPHEQSTESNGLVPAAWSTSWSRALACSAGVWKTQRMSLWNWGNKTIKHNSNLESQTVHRTNMSS